MSKFLSDNWMFEHHFVDATLGKKSKVSTWWANGRVGDLNLAAPLTLSPDVSIHEAIQVMNEQGFDMVPVQSKTDGKVLGVITAGQLTAMLTTGKVKSNDPCVSAMYKGFSQVSMSTGLD